MYRRVPIISLLALLVGCSKSEPQSGTDNVVVAQAGLKRLATCGDLDGLIRERSRASMNKSLDDAIASLKSSTASSTLCRNYSYPTLAMAAGTGAVDTTATVAPAPTSVSETNNQVVGVDEADLVKTDGRYIYLAQGSELRIVEAWPAANAAIASRVTLAGTAKRLFVNGDRALVYVSVPRTTENVPNAAWMRSAEADCTYGYSCDFSGDGTATKLVIFDTSNRAAPTIVRTIDTPGSLIAARRIGNTVHTVVSIGEVQIPNLELYSNYNACNAPPTGDALTAEIAKIEQLRVSNNEKIDAAQLDVGVLAREGSTVLGAKDCSDFYRETQTDGTGITTVLSLDLTSNAEPTLANVISRAGAVYASSSSLYMSVPHRRMSGYDWYATIAEDEASTVHRFQIGTDPTQTAYLASGVVPGHVLNQFSMDEYQDVLRIATSKGEVPDPDVESVLTTLQRNGASLDVLGQISGIAPTEDIRSVRFQGERGYVVTFKKTDPLFVLDLRDPRKPAITGELKIPGFSTYMHPLDATHLLALGYAADDQGSFAFFNGIQLQIFDVTNITDPRLLHKQVYGTRGSSSSALTDHLGFTFLPDRGLLTLPMSICDGGGNGSYGTLSFSGVVAMNVSIANGFTEIGRLEEPYPESQVASGFYYGGACSDWWTDSNSVVERTVVLDDYLYAVSDNRVRIQNLNSLGTDVKSVDF